MYTKRVQIVNYGPIDHIDVVFPFDDGTPQPVVFVGENGSGKSILLSHIVNAVVSAKDLVYSDTPEVEIGRVYKLRSASYIKHSRDYYFARTDFEHGLYVAEIMSTRPKHENADPPSETSPPDLQSCWHGMKPDSRDHYVSTIHQKEATVRDLFAKRCALYFPPNRYEEPAWLNEMNLKSRAEYMSLSHTEGQTSRRLIHYSPLNDNKNWLFDVVYDRSVFETRTTSVPIATDGRGQPVHLPVQLAPTGNATSVFDIALQVVRTVLRGPPDTRLGIGRRRRRVVSIEGKGTVVPNIFQLSTGETGLLNLFLSILRDFDLCGSPFRRPGDVRGIIIVDEVDLHLHAVHQYEILPALIRLFPNVQFVLTTHSPLFVLGMNDVFGESGFRLFRLPSGQKISPEEFNEFESAYRSFTATTRFSNDLQSAIEHAQKPIVFLEGTIDVQYVRKAACLLGHDELLERIELRDGGGAGISRRSGVD